MATLTITDTDVHVLECDRPWAIVRVETDAGITGIGEVPPTRHRTAQIERFGQNLVGEDPFETEVLFGGGGGINDLVQTTMAGGFDMACWDIKGKYNGVPVHDLLGGAVNEPVRAYANGWDFEAREVAHRYHDGEDPDTVLEDTKETIADAARDVVDAGYDALKFSPFQWGTGANTTRLELDNAFEVIEAVYDAVDDDVELLIEGHSNLSTGKAIAAAERLEQFDPGFYEEPVPAEVGPLRRVARNSPVPIATGESFTTHRAFPELLSNTEVSVVQPDMGRAGGITELWKIAGMASAERKGFAPHNAAGPVMTHAAAHVDAATPSFMIQETFERFYHPDWGDDLIDGLTIEDGRIHLPDEPGLGFELDYDVLEAHENRDALPR